MKYILGIDQSTSATKAILFDEDSRLVDRVSVEHKQFYPLPGWVEHDPEEILQNTYEAIKLLLDKSKINPSDVSSVAITNQRETVVVWNKRTGKPVYNAIVWQCNRGAEICEDLISRGYENFIMEKTGLIINPYFSASGARWILENVEGAARSAKKGDLLFGTMDSWLIWNFTSGKVHATDYTNASRTLLFNIHSLSWDNELLELFDIPSVMMPEVFASDQRFGTTDLNGLISEVAIAGVLGDSHGALAGQMCFSRGMGKATYGTGSSIMVNVGEKPITAPRGLVTSIGFAALGKVFYVFEGNIHYTGATIKWLQDELQLIHSSEETELLANSIKDTDGVYLVPAFTGLGAPWWDSNAKALICGMNRGTTKAHIARAALESIAYQVKDLIRLIDESDVTLNELRVDGGPTKNNFLMQFQADILKVKINRSGVEEASVFGAVIMNSLAINRYGSFEEAAALRQNSDHFTPNMTESKVDKLYSGWKKAVKLTLSQ